MKVLKTTLLLIMGAFMFIQPVGAIVSSTHTTATTIEQQTSTLKKEFKKEKRFSKLNDLLAKKGVDLNDPVKKWLWLTILFVAASVVLSVLGVGGILARLVWAAASVCFLIWLAKYFELF